MHQIFGNRKVVTMMLAMLMVPMSGFCEEPQPKVAFPHPHPLIAFHLRAKGETWAFKFARFRRESLVSGFKGVPQIYLSADLGARVVEPLENAPLAETLKIPGLIPMDESPTERFSFDASLRYISELFGFVVQKTEFGYVIDLPEVVR